MEQIHQELLAAKEQGYTAIDISGNEVVFTDIDDRYQDYGFIVIDGMYIYDKYGDKIDERGLRSIPGATSVFSLKNIGSFSPIIVRENTKFYPLSYALRQFRNKLYIACYNIYIPAWVFEGIVASEITLVHPNLDDDVLRAIHCYEVTIRLSRDYQPLSFESLECTVFKLEYFSHQETASTVPIMPKNATDITLEITADYSQNLDIAFSDNKTVQKLKLMTRLIVSLDKLPLLHFLDCNRISMVSISLEVLQQLETLILPTLDLVNITGRDDRVYIMEHRTVVNLYTTPIPNIITFSGNFYNDEQYLLLSGLKKLTVRDKILKPEYIPIGLEEYYCLSFNGVNYKINDIKKLENHLFGMKSIKRMPLLLLPDTDLSFDTRYDVYYDVCIISESTGFICYPSLKKSIMEADSLPELGRVILHNERYNKRNKTLELLSKEKKMYL